MSYVDKNLVNVITLHKKLSFLLNISSVNVSKFEETADLQKKSLMENFIFRVCHEDDKDVIILCLLLSLNEYLLEVYIGPWEASMIVLYFRK